jgi:ribose transport system substrate-binding protein
VGRLRAKAPVARTDQRQQGFEQAIKGQSGLKYIGSQYSQDEPARAASIVTATLAKNPDLKGIFATNLFSAEGAASGLKQAGKLGKVKIVGFDAGPKQVNDLKSGLVQALIAQKPAEIGRLGVDQALNALGDKPVRKKIGTGFVVVTQKNLSAPNVSRYLYQARC